MNGNENVGQQAAAQAAQVNQQNEAPAKPPKPAAAGPWVTQEAFAQSVDECGEEMIGAVTKLVRQLSKLNAMHATVMSVTPKHMLDHPECPVPALLSAQMHVSASIRVIVMCMVPLGGKYAAEAARILVDLDEADQCMVIHEAIGAENDKKVNDLMQMLERAGLGHLFTDVGKR